MGDGIEAHFARKPLGLAEVGAELLQARPRLQAAVRHRHAEQEEIYLVLSGTARSSSTTRSRAADWTPCASPTPSRAAWRPGREGGELIAFGAPNTDNKDIDMQPGFLD